MNHKSILSMMEQLVMILVFALAAALCVQTFVFSHLASRRYALQDRMAVEAQSLAETLKSVRGDLLAAAEKAGGVSDGENWIVYYHADGTQTREPADCRIEISCLETGLETMGGADLTVYEQDDRILFSLPVAWQEVTGNE